MNNQNGNAGNASEAVHLLFVSAQNIHKIVARIAPHLVLVDREQFATAANGMIGIIDSVSAQPLSAVASVPRQQFAEVAADMLVLVEGAAANEG